MDPDQEVAPRWWTVRAAGADGVMREGFRMNEDSFSLRIMDTDSNLWSFQKRELENYERLENPLCQVMPNRYLMANSTT